MVHDEISLLLHHRREMALTTKTMIAGRATTTFSDRDKAMQRLTFTVINLDKLTTSQIDLFKLIWEDLVDFPNKSLVVLPFRREPLTLLPVACNTLEAFPAVPQWGQLSSLHVVQCGQAVYSCILN